MVHSFKIALTANLNGNSIECAGLVDIEKIEKNFSYATWKVFTVSNRELVAGVSREYYHGEKKITVDEILSMVIKNIIKYRIGRKQIFSNINLL